MKQAFLKVLILLYQNYMKQTNQTIPDFEAWIFDSLRKNQFILDKLEASFKVNIHNPEFSSESQIESKAIRMYSIEEAQRLNTECQGYLLSLEQKGIITSHIREKIIQKALTLDKKIQLDELKWLIYEFISKNESSFSKFFTMDPNFNLSLKQILH